MKQGLPALLSLYLLAGGFSCSDSPPSPPKSSTSQALPITPASTEASKGVAMYIAFPQKNNQENCQLDLTKLTLIGKPLTESDIAYYDQSAALFKLNVSLYDWLWVGTNTVAADSINRNYTSRCITLMLDGQPVFGGIVLSDCSSTISCAYNNPPYFNVPCLPPLPTGAASRPEESYQLTVAQNQRPSPSTNLGDPLLSRLKAVGKLRN
ncbi:hypothetical protein [Spirosoma aerolatum]|uniref:hypothetical protein n=1 Tax=Spirosoma aerolatum TaxID=1211326 RepID=UPI0009ABDEB0|nr:hypothetical protein [Spirosoma aerolatum]